MASTPIEATIEYRPNGSEEADDWKDIRADIQVKFNKSVFYMLTPEQLSHSSKASITNQSRKENVTLAWTHSSINQFSTSFFVDTSEVPLEEQANKNCMTIVKLMRKNMLLPVPIIEGSKPLPAVRFKYAQFTFAGFITSMEEKYNYFSSDGYPLRAEISFTFMRKISPAKSKQQQEGWSSSRAVRIVKPGDRLDLIANQYYRDPALWREIAQENNIQSPRLFPRPSDLGTELILPDLAIKR